MKYYLPTLLLILLHCTCGRAQVIWDDIRIETSRNTVVATGGLNLRAEPGTHGKIASKLPYGAAVEILETTLYAPDKVNPLDEYLQPNGWVRVRAGRDTGYLYDAYLYYDAVCL